MGIDLEVITFLTVIALGIFTFFKNPSSGVNRTFFMLCLTMSGWLFCGFLISSQIRAGINPYTTSKFSMGFASLMAAALVSFFINLSPKIRKVVVIRIYIIVYALAFISFMFALQGFYIKNITIINKVAIREFSKGIYFLASFLFAAVAYTVFNLVKMYRSSNTAQKKKLQIKYVILGIIFFTMVAIIFSLILPILGFNKLFAIGYTGPAIFTGFLAYAIIRHHLMEIDTVIHRTILWLATSLWLILPLYVVFSLSRPWLQSITTLWLSFVALGMFYVFLWYYRYFQPRIDHFFRRRKYDYYKVLEEMGQKIGSELELEKVQDRIFKELKDVLYIRNGMLLVQQPGKEDYEEAGSVGYAGSGEVSKGKGQALTSYTLAFESKLIQWVNREQKALEREEVETDPQYQEIKEEALEWFKRKELEILIPIVLEGKVNGLLGMGKKENLQAYTQKDIELLEKMGRQMGIIIDNALHHGDIVEKERLAEELELGRQIQMSLLPKESPTVAGLQIAGVTLPAKEIGGDYYDYIVTNGKLAIVIGDVSGKGVGAGIIMAMAKASLENISELSLCPKETLVKLNHSLCKQTQSQKFMTMLYLEWNPGERKLHYCSAGHEHIIIYRQSGKTGESWEPQVEVIQSGGIVLGMLAEIAGMLEERELKLESGDKVVLYSDGVIDAHNEQEELYSLRRLTETVKQHGAKPAAELLTTIKDEVARFSGKREQYDDITLVVLEAE